MEESQSSEVSVSNLEMTSRKALLQYLVRKILVKNTTDMAFLVKCLVESESYENNSWLIIAYFKWKSGFEESTKEFQNTVDKPCL
ncbi:UNVERIFIED_CONTAM: hypothetical protein NCL1_35846 [Trichonephila clavipes]